VVLQGVILPFQVTATGDVANGMDPDLAVSKVQLVLSTRPGEVDWRPDFGCAIHTLRHQNNTDVLGGLAGVWIRKAFTDWLPNYVLTSVTPLISGRTLALTVKFNLRSATGAPLFPRDLETQIQVPLAAAAAVAS
jgi:phage baseplate assembly protein W